MGCPKRSERVASGARTEAFQGLKRRSVILAVSRMCPIFLFHHLHAERPTGEAWSWNDIVNIYTTIHIVIHHFFDSVSGCLHSFSFTYEVQPSFQYFWRDDCVCIVFNQGKNSGSGTFLPIIATVKGIFIFLSVFKTPK